MKIVNEEYKNKYLKYKNRYFNLVNKNKLKGGSSEPFIFYFGSLSLIGVLLWLIFKKPNNGPFFTSSLSPVQNNITTNRNIRLTNDYKNPLFDNIDNMLSDEDKQRIQDEYNEELQSNCSSASEDGSIQQEDSEDIDQDYDRDDELDQDYDRDYERDEELERDDERDEELERDDERDEELERDDERDEELERDDERDEESDEEEDEEEREEEDEEEREEEENLDTIDDEEIARSLQEKYDIDLAKDLSENEASIKLAKDLQDKENSEILKKLEKEKEEKENRYRKKDEEPILDVDDLNELNIDDLVIRPYSNGDLLVGEVYAVVETLDNNRYKIMNNIHSDLLEVFRSEVIKIDKDKWVELSSMNIYNYDQLKDAFLAKYTSGDDNFNIEDYLNIVYQSEIFHKGNIVLLHNDDDTFETVVIVDILKNSVGKLDYKCKSILNGNDLNTTNKNLIKLPLTNNQLQTLFEIYKNHNIILDGLVHWYENMDNSDVNIEEYLKVTYNIEYNNHIQFIEDEKNKSRSLFMQHVQELCEKCNISKGDKLIDCIRSELDNVLPDSNDHARLIAMLEYYNQPENKRDFYNYRCKNTSDEEIPVSQMEEPIVIKDNPEIINSHEQISEVTDTSSVKDATVIESVINDAIESVKESNKKLNENMSQTAPTKYLQSLNESLRKKDVKKFSKTVGDILSDPIESISFLQEVKPLLKPGIISSKIQSLDVDKDKEQDKLEETIGSQKTFESSPKYDSINDMLGLLEQKLEEDPVKILGQNTTLNEIVEERNSQLSESIKNYVQGEEDIFPIITGKFTTQEVMNQSVEIRNSDNISDDEVENVDALIDVLQDALDDEELSKTEPRGLASLQSLVNVESTEEDNESESNDIEDEQNANRRYLLEIGKEVNSNYKKFKKELKGLSVTEKQREIRNYITNLSIVDYICLLSYLDNKNQKKKEPKLVKRQVFLDIFLSRLNNLNKDEFEELQQQLLNELEDSGQLDEKMLEELYKLKEKYVDPINERYFKFDKRCESVIQNQEQEIKQSSVEDDEELVRVSTNESVDGLRDMLDNALGDTEVKEKPVDPELIKQLEVQGKINNKFWKEVLDKKVQEDIQDKQNRDEELRNKVLGDKLLSEELEKKINKLSLDIEQLQITSQSITNPRNILPIEREIGKKQEQLKKLLAQQEKLLQDQLLQRR